MYDAITIGMIGGDDGPTAVYTWYGQFSFAVYVAIIVALAVASYMIGNISPSTIMAKSKGIDIKKSGSGNAGTTNALRVLGKKAGVITLVIDIFKGFAAVSLGYIFGGMIGGYICAAAVFLGHVWPVIYKFKGGKGVATAFGATLGMNPIMALLALIIVAIALFISKRMSIGSITGAVAYPLLALWLEPEFFLFSIFMAMLVLFKHKGNIWRLCSGEEPIMSIFEKKNKEDESDREDT